MKIPTTPPDFIELIESLTKKSAEKLGEIFTLDIKADYKDQYYHWDKLRYLKLPANVKSHEEWWLGIKFARRALYKKIPHTDKYGHPFVYSEPDLVRKLLHEIDIHGGGELKASQQVASPNTRDTYLINSLIEEAITSSQLEGAATTRKVAKEMLRQKRKPRDKSEQMIVNNFHAMEFINDIANEPLTPEIILELHGIVTKETMNEPDQEGKLRTSDDVYVGDERDSTIIHTPPNAAELEERLKNLCEFANQEEVLVFIHPVIRAIMLHFLLAYDHPFEDGNGRTARALFYWSMLKQGYWTMEFVSISRILKKAPAQYTRAFLYTETDDNDLTYFIVHQLQVIKRSILELLAYLERKSKEIQSIAQFVKKSDDLNRLLNHRQLALINRALKSPDAEFYIESHRGAHSVTYQTARTDLLHLVELGLLEQFKEGRAFVFTPVQGLKQKLESMSK